MDFKLLIHGFRKILYEKGPKVVVITLGEKGSIAFDGEEFHSAAAYNVNVIDTTGAGDNFHGAFLYGYLEKWSISRILSFSNAFAALTCLGLGGREAIHSLSKTEQLIKTVV